MYAFNDNWLDLGTCNLCSKTVKAAGCTSHLKSCIPKTLGLKPVQIDAGAAAGARKDRYMLLKVDNCGVRDYWLQLGVRADVTLSELDGFLRKLWLECCGHLSEFIIQDVSYVSPSWGFDAPMDDDRSMDVAVGTVLPYKAYGRHIYDFGSSTELHIQSTNLYSVPDGQRDLDRIQVLARNIAPEFACDTCGKPALYLELDEDDMWEYRHCCGDHRSEDEEGYGYNIVNSPRCGVCAYGR